MTLNRTCHDAHVHERSSSTMRQIVQKKITVVMDAADDINI
jgi:hypothetical protein